MNELKKERWKKKKKEHINDVGNKKRAKQEFIDRLELIDGLSVNIDGIRKPLLDLYFFSEVKIP